MPASEDHSFEKLFAALREDAQRLAEAFRFGREPGLRIEFGTDEAWDPGRLPDYRARPGIAICLTQFDAAYVWLVSESILPEDWTSRTDAEREESLDVAGQALAEVIAGNEGSTISTEVRQVDVLDSAIEVLEVQAGCRFVEASLLQTDSSGDASGGIVFAGPFVSSESDPSEAEPTRNDGETADEIHEALHAGFGPPSSESDGHGEETQDFDPDRIRRMHREEQERLAAATKADAPCDVRTRRLMKLPVTVVVRLAERRIEVRQLLSMTVGTLITFDKSCEDALGLYVNNHLYCQGETVKIGEKFGLKIDRIGASEPRTERILYG